MACGMSPINSLLDKYLPNIKRVRSCTFPFPPSSYKYCKLVRATMTSGMLPLKLLLDKFLDLSQCQLSLRIKRTHTTTWDWKTWIFDLGCICQPNFWKPPVCEWSKWMETEMNTDITPIRTFQFSWDWSYQFLFWWSIFWQSSKKQHFRLTRLRPFQGLP